MEQIIKHTQEKVSFPIGLMPRDAPSFVSHLLFKYELHPKNELSVIVVFA